MRAANAWSARRGNNRGFTVTAIEVHRVSKDYLLSTSPIARLRRLLNPGKRNSGETIWALRDVSFTVDRGEAFGIIGANGSGKSTLLQIIAGILRPASGSVEVRGRLAALLELGAGFSPEFTGRDNVYLNGSLLGLTREEIDARFEAIERFAAIGDFIAQPIKTYSTGMVLRLAFAVAAHVDPEVLIVDEALAVGDIAFRQRCMRKIHDLRARGVTILFVSHESTDVKALCDRCLWLKNGCVEALGDADEVVGKYLSATLLREKESDARKPVNRDAPPPGIASGAKPEIVTGFPGPVDGYRYGDERALILGARIAGAESGVTFAAGAHLVVRLSFRTKSRVDAPIAGFVVRNTRGEVIFASNTARENHPMPAMEAEEEGTVDFYMTAPGLIPGTYRVSIGIAEGDIDSFRMCDYIEDALEFRMAAVNSSADSRGYFQLRCAAITVHSVPLEQAPRGDRDSATA